MTVACITIIKTILSNILEIDLSNVDLLLIVAPTPPAMATVIVASWELLLFAVVGWSISAITRNHRSCVRKNKKQKTKQNKKKNRILDCHAI